MENNPRIVADTPDYTVVFKPPKMHSTRNVSQKKTDVTLYDWYKNNCPDVYDIMHRLDFETHGLALFAKNEKSYTFFKSMQDRGEFIKEYSAACRRADGPEPDGFPPRPEKNMLIESYFRPFGRGRKQVRPVIEDGKKHKEIAADRGGLYRTEITSISGEIFTVRIRRGFRHQIRCHLCWIGFPIENDPLYSPYPHQEGAILPLRAHALFFADPSTGDWKEYCIDPLS
jgi:23S rRNA pseudouridine1911/1915/1917 synthase